MMKNNKFCILGVVVIMVSFLGLFSSCDGLNSINYNNEQSIEDCITSRYSSDEINDLFTSLKKGNVDLRHIKSKFKIQCTRKTFQGYYIVLLREDNAKLFIFLNNELQINNYILINEVKTYNDFTILTADCLTKNQVLESYNNCVNLTSFSADITTKHCVKEGIVIVKYDTENVVKNTTLVSYDEIEENTYGNSYLPYIISMDR